MSEKVFLQHSGTPHEGSIPHSGRFPWGSGENPGQHRFDLLYEVERMKKSGAYKNETEIAKALGYSSGELRAIKQALSAERDAMRADKARKLKEKGYSNIAIGKELGAFHSAIVEETFSGGLSQLRRFSTSDSGNPHLSPAT